jgi:hypothetical protein
MLPVATSNDKHVRILVHYSFSEFADVMNWAY